MPRCRVGDKCLVIVGRDAGFEVTCLELMGDNPIIQLPDMKARMGGRNVWRLDRELRWPIAGMPAFCWPVPYAADNALLPLRGEPDAEYLTTETQSDRRAKAPPLHIPASET